MVPRLASRVGANLTQKEIEMLLFASLSLVLAAAEGVPTATYTLSIPHHAGPVSAEYQGEVAVHHKQVGAPAPGGRSSTLRCAWRADLKVYRVATSAAGAMASRTFTHSNVASGNRPGWCSTNRTAIAADVAARVGDAHQHLASAAREDQMALKAELERLTVR
jgi:hypothetical protein